MSRPMKMIENFMMLPFKAKAVGEGFRKEARKPLTNSGAPWEIIKINIVWFYFIAKQYVPNYTLYSYTNHKMLDQLVKTNFPL